MIVPIDFFRREPVTKIARDLIGLKFVSSVGNIVTSGIITETEAYAGEGDQACHAHLGRFTDRTKVMYEPGGIAYIYLCYGIHHLFNVVTNKKGNADAVLIRAIHPIDGIQEILKRRNASKLTKNLLNGPGKVTQALGISKDLNALSLDGNSPFWFEFTDKNFEINQIETSPRIGIDYAGEDKNLPWRFTINPSLLT